jgi:hypothetical protein
MGEHWLAPQALGMAAAEAAIFIFRADFFCSQPAPAVP